MILCFYPSLIPYLCLCPDILQCALIFLSKYTNIHLNVIKNKEYTSILYDSFLLKFFCFFYTIYTYSLFLQLLHLFIPNCFLFFHLLSLDMQPTTLSFYVFLFSPISLSIYVYLFFFSFTCLTFSYPYYYVGFSESLTDSSPIGRGIWQLLLWS